MKLYTKKIQCEERIVNATVTRSMVDDLLQWDEFIKRQKLLELRKQKIEKILNRIHG